jgi:Domain of unknown function (DUF4390)
MWRAALSCTLLWLSVVFAPAHAGNMEIRSPYVVPVAGVYLLNAELLFTTPADIEPALRDGATLTLEMQIRVQRTRRWWRDEVLAQLQQRYSLIYHGVSQRFLVRNENSGAQSSYATFAEAIGSLQHIGNLPVLDQALVQPDARNEVSLRTTMAVHSIPRVLGMLLFWVDNFSLESDWYTWPLKP